jgi:hypothetical protein
MSTSTLKVTDPITLPVYAVPVKVSRIALVDKPDIHAAITAFQRDAVMTESHSHQFSIVPRDQAALEVDISHDYVVFNNVNSRIQALGYSRMPYRVKMGETKIIRSILQAAGHFNSFLGLSPEDRRLRDFIKVEFLEIMRPEDRAFGPGVQRRDAQNLCKGDLVEVNAGDTPYGIKVTNNSSLQLYPYLFLFDCSDLSIGKHYTIHLQICGH